MDPAGPLVIVALLLVLFSIKAGLIGFAVLAEVLWPQTQKSLLQAYRTSPMRCFIVGLVNGIGLFVIAVLLISTEVLALPGLLVLATIWVLAVFGRGITYRYIGGRLSSASGQPDRVREIVHGGIIAELAFLVPIVGQVLYAGYFFRGIGAVTLTLLARGVGSDDLASTHGVDPPAD